MDLLATQVMRRNVHAVRPSLSLPELEKAFVESQVSGFPVVDGDQVIGVVTRGDVIAKLKLERDTALRTSDYFLDANEVLHEIPVSSEQQVADRVGERMEELTVADIMHSEVVAVRPDQPLRLVAELMVDRGVHRVLVTLEGRLLGVITTADFVRLYAQGKIRAAE